MIFLFFLCPFSFPICNKPVIYLSRAAMTPKISVTIPKHTK